MRAPLTPLKDDIAEADAALAARFWAGDDIDELVQARAHFFDDFLVRLWRSMGPEFATDSSDVALFAVGGYGRGELHPHSDIDVLILTLLDDEEMRARLTAFVQTLWDLNLSVGHSVRALADCQEESARDLTVATSFLERRLLAGKASVDAELEAALDLDEHWPDTRFFRAKRDEQERRHRRFEHVEYNLEPDIKGSPGGLRDIQMVSWIVKRHFGTTNFDELTRRGFLTPSERRNLNEGRRFLWRVRFGLHLLAGRGENRLLFDYQRTLAARLGYEGTSAQLSVERFMHDYYKHVLALREVNDVLLQHFDEAILRADEAPEIEEINARFRIRDSYIEITHANVFRQDPASIMELFVIMANRRDISGVRAETIRAVRSHLYLIDEKFRHDLRVTALFMDLLRAPYTLVSQLTRMRRYGVLGRYIPEFGRVIGQMQHDLFHIYTVDAHTMMVIRNMRRFFYRSSQETFPVASHTVKNIPRIELLYIAGLFHDIGKGRGGDHSELGAEDVVAFCERHAIAEKDIALVEWLVRDHLLMSTTAQRKDIHDPEIVHDFATAVKTETRLDYLYALTVADINATNPNLWNGWRAALLRQLYSETRKALRRGLASPIDRREQIDDRRNAALDRLEARGLSREKVARLWDNPDPEFFLRHTPGQVIAITEAIQNHEIERGPLVLVRDMMGLVSQEGATEVLLYTKNRPHLFATSVMALSELDLSIHDAHVYTAEGDLCFNSYIVLDESGQSVGDNPRRKRHIEEALVARLTATRPPRNIVERRVPRRLKQFLIATEVTAEHDSGSPFTTLRVVAADRPGLLARLGLIFIDLGLSVQSARITTLGERVEDTFFITDEAQRPITDPARLEGLTEEIRQRLDSALRAREAAR